MLAMERDTWQGLRDRFRIDPAFAEGVKKNFRDELAISKAKGQKDLASYLDALSGIADFAIKGTVYIPLYTRAFGDWMVENTSEFIGTEEVSTQEGDPFYHRGKLPYTIRTSYIDANHEVAVLAEEAIEDGQPRVFYPNRLERFELFKLNSGNILFERDRRFDERIMQKVFPQN